EPFSGKMKQVRGWGVACPEPISVIWGAAPSHILFSWRWATPQKWPPYIKKGGISFRWLTVRQCGDLS
ncbi:MAG: hypothetical protein LUF68_01975, partial [Clostridiales bacterium]|nr:hypothetical protein [Clostridiales bacterium]